MKAIVASSCIIMLLSACTSDSVTITGKIKNYDDQIVFVEKKTGLSYQNIDTLYVDDDGAFQYKIIEETFGHYRLNFNYRTRVGLMVNDRDLTVEVDASRRKGNVEIKGSPDHRLIEEITEINQSFNDLESVKKIREQYVKANKTGDKALLQEAKLQYEEALEEKDEMIKELIEEGLEQEAYLGVLEAMYGRVLDPGKEPEFYQKVANELAKAKPDEAITKQFYGFVSIIVKSNER